MPMPRTPIFRLPLLPVALLLLLVASFCVAKAEVAELRISYTNLDPAFTKVLKRYSEQYDQNVSFEWLDQTDLRSRLLRANHAGELPHALIAAEDVLGVQQSIKFDDVPASFGLTESSDAQVLSLTKKAIRITRGNQLVLYFNKSLTPKAPENWEALLNERPADQQGIELIGWSLLDMYWLIPFITSFNSQAELTPKEIIVSPHTFSAMSYVWNMINQGVVKIDCGYTCYSDKFKSGQLVYTINGTWLYQEYKRVLGENLGLAILPNLKNKPMRSYYSYMVIAFPAGSLSGEQGERLEQFTAYLLSDDVQQEFLNTATNLPVRGACIKPKHNEKCGVSHDAFMLAESINQSILMPHGLDMPLFWEALLKGFVRVGGGDQSALQAKQFMSLYFNNNNNNAKTHE
nr:extracellular solute-binding protein [Saccharophagus degradans]